MSFIFTFVLCIDDKLEYFIPLSYYVCMFLNFGMKCIFCSEDLPCTLMKMHVNLVE